VELLILGGVAAGFVGVLAAFLLAVAGIKGRDESDASESHRTRR